MAIKKTVAVILVCLMSLFAFSACNDNDENGNDTQKIYYTATFNFSNGDDPYTVKVEEGALITPPIAPERENYIFNGWKQKGYIWNFDTNYVFSDVSFTAQWIDASSIFSTQKNSDDSLTVTEYKGSLTEIRIPEIISGFRVSAIGDGVFQNFADGNATVIVLPKSITSVGTAAFEGCSELKVIVEGSLSHVGERAFNGCLQLESIAFDDSLTQIPFKTFAGCSALKDIKIAKGTKTIGEDAFDGCSAIQTLIISSKELSVENSAFADCDALVTVFFEGTEEEWNAVYSKIDVGGSGNADLLDAKVYFYSETEAAGDFWYYNADGEPRCC